MSGEIFVTISNLPKPFHTKNHVNPVQYIYCMYTCINRRINFLIQKKTTPVLRLTCFRVFPFRFILRNVFYFIILTWSSSWLKKKKLLVTSNNFLIGLFSCNFLHEFGIIQPLIHYSVTVKENLNYDLINHAETVLFIFQNPNPRYY